MRLNLILGTTAAVVCAGVMCSGVVQAAPARPQETPLADANLFISPCGQVYRSNPGDPYPVVAWFKTVDTNHDGKIDRAEFRAEAEAFFHQLDLRKNGIIDDEIIGLYEKKVVPEILAAFTPTVLRGEGAALVKVQAGSIDPGGPPDLPEPKIGETKPQGAAVYGLLNDGEPLRSADRSFRGRIKLEDILAQADRNFDALDDEHRGYLTLEDLPRTPAQRAARLARKK